MPIEIEKLDKFKERVDEYPGLEIFYRKYDTKTGVQFDILAGKASWRGTLEGKEALSLETWLEKHDAIKITKWVELSELFAG